MKTIVLSFFYLLLFAAIISLGWLLFRYNLNLVCSSSMVVFNDNLTNTSIFNLSQRLSFYRNGSVFSNVSGELHVEGKTLLINRIVTYHYARVGASEYEFAVKRVDKTSRDNVPDELEGQFISSMTSGTKRIISIHELPSKNIIISYSSGPYLVCARH